ncbi:MAG: N-acetylmuramoyl-L-alanine amidase family protein [Planktothrix sp.]
MDKQQIKGDFNSLRETYKHLGTMIDNLEREIGDLNKPSVTPNKSNGITIYLNAGHGSIHPNTGEYMTFAGDGKFYTFTDALGKELETAYEGLLNRQYADRLSELLEKSGFRVVKTYHEYLDRTNVDRAAIANNDHTGLKASGFSLESAWVSIHFNAAGMQSRGKSINARGVSIWTHPGQNESDKIAQCIWAEFKELTKGFGISYREDLRDGDADNEEYFQEFTMTVMPAVLLETLFFTNWEDYQIAKTVRFREAVCMSILNGLKQYFKV